MTIPTICGRCGQKVFYYRNEFGSKVFFDELGGDWPKHDCSGNQRRESKKMVKPVVILIKRRSTNAY